MHLKHKPDSPRKSPQAGAGRRVISSKWISLASVVVVLCVSAFALPRTIESNLDGYSSYDELTASLKSLVKSHPNLARLESTGKTLEGRDIWMIEVGNQSGTPIQDRPVLLMAANFEGNQVGTS